MKLSLPTTLVMILDAVQVPLPSATLRALASAALPDRQVTPEALGRIAAYTEESYLKTRDTPRFAWVLDPDGKAAKPRIWARGTWRLSRRIRTQEAVGHWSVVLANDLCRRMTEGGEDERELLAPAALEAVGRVLGPRAMHLPGPREEWQMLARQVALLQHPTGPAHPLSGQTAAESELQARDLTPYGLFFGIREAGRSQAGEAPPDLRLPVPGEAGTPFDEIVLARAGGDHSRTREVLAFIQEWSVLSDDLGEEPTLAAYAERWRTDLETARFRNEQFRSLFPTETSPRRVLALLWEAGSNESFPRLLGKELIQSELPPTVITHFVTILADRMRDRPALGSRVMAELTGFENQAPARAGGEQRRFFALCEQLRLWCARALVAAGEPQRAAGALSLEPIFDESSAAYAQAMIGEYRRELAAGPNRQLLVNAQRALRVAATLDALNPPPDAAPFLEGVTFAAAALAEAGHEEVQIDLATEARNTVRMLEAIQ